MYKYNIFYEQALEQKCSQACFLRDCAPVSGGRVLVTSKVLLPANQAGCVCKAAAEGGKNNVIAALKLAGTV